ncbi:MAG: aspartate carbamoyltransferase regulatory subunit [Candidatus Micrarchaeota archaeon]|nr:aspartate carbamoyltransferase regulatory subunit [Candidatus Micrarchaeota archaeon]
MPLNVQKISDGSVVDHIAAGAGSKVLAILSSSHPIEGMAALIINAPSKKLGRKDIVKIENVFIDETTANKIALIAPKATVNIIRGGEVVDKHHVEMPKTLSGLLSCPNPKCITNSEKAKTSFSLEESGSMRCRHCERLFKPEELV